MKILKNYPARAQKIFFFIKYYIGAFARTEPEIRNRGNTEYLCSYIMCKIDREN